MRLWLATENHSSFGMRCFLTSLEKRLVMSQAARDNRENLGLQSQRYTIGILALSR